MSAGPPPAPLGPAALAAAAPGEAHEHVFLGASHGRNERRSWIVIGLTTGMMLAEIAAGHLFGSMALVADGWHMATHAAALLIAALAYRYARRHARDRRFTFGTGKLGDLAGFASAIVLALVALLIGWESLLRLRAPVPIDFAEAIAVALLGLGVNLASAWLLRDAPHHHGHGPGHDDHDDHDDDHHHGHHHGHRHGGDTNLRAAYLHVLADALTSVLAIAALLLGSLYGWLWPDPLMGLAGALVIARWSAGLIREAGGVLLDDLPAEARLPAAIREAVEDGEARITDLHVWQLGPGHHGAILSIAAAAPRPPSHDRRKLAHLPALSHVTIEVEPAAPRGG
ncbi:CDF family Co(II)/Ni(II) efflux transporter DmeF [Roseicella frigidaeris]|uniref:Cation transporter n=1 Tax=Roseicella frigidaeris TaxID=2230885 RepID=A0A327M4T8_9PROT|nr:CDF family Co(II)/Ni(II) efflux transporter DmeF [Roseicella frigidaeris]RAI58281.1 cation transporter [Roseicella frigidaeris]